MTAATLAHSTPLTGLHLLLSYECNYQAEEAGTIEWIYFEGGEPFLFYELLCSGVQLAHERGFKAGIVSNAFWATSDEEALGCLQPFAGMVEDLSISHDIYHGSKDLPQQTQIARKAARRLGIPVDFIKVAGSEASAEQARSGQFPANDSTVLYRGRAAEKLAPRVEPKPWYQFTECKWEELRHPDRVHVDVYGNLHICQGISIGNLFRNPLIEIMDGYDPCAHPIIGPIIVGGPVELVNRYALPHGQTCADACHLCYTSRNRLTDRFPKVLTPCQMYGKKRATQVKDHDIEPL